MNIYRKEMKTHLRSLLFWCLGIGLFIAASMTKYGAMAAEPSAANLFTELPMGLQAVFGVGQLDYTKASGFFGMVYSYLLLMAAIHASMTGAVGLSREERDHTTEFLYAKPVSRGTVLTSKLLAMLTQVAVFTLFCWVCSVGMVRSFGEDADAVIGRLMLGMALLQLVFLTLGVFAASLPIRSKGATGLATGVLLATYVMSIAIDVNGKIDWLKGFTPFAYFDAKSIVGKGEGLSAVFVAVSLGISAVMLLLAYLRFPRRDLYI